MIKIHSVPVILMVLTWILFISISSTNISATMIRSISASEYRDSIIVENYSRVIVIKVLFPKHSFYIYRRVAVLTSDEYTKYYSHLLNEIAEVRKSLGIITVRRTPPSPIQSKIIKEVMTILTTNGFHRIRPFYYEDGTIWILVYNDAEMNKKIISALVDVVNKYGGNRIVLQINPSSWYALSRFMGKLDEAIRNIEKEYGDEFRGVKMYLGVGLFPFIGVQGVDNLSRNEINKLIDRIRKELGDDNTFFLLMLDDWKGEPLYKHISESDINSSITESNSSALRSNSTVDTYSIHYNKRKVSIQTRIEITALALLPIIAIFMFLRKIH